jgi:hypothetical protein
MFFSVTHLQNIWNSFDNILVCVYLLQHWQVLCIQLCNVEPFIIESSLFSCSKEAFASQILYLNKFISLIVSQSGVTCVQATFLQCPTLHCFGGLHIMHKYNEQLSHLLHTVSCALCKECYW